MGGFTLDQSQGAGDLVGKLETFNVLATHATLLAIGDAVIITGTSVAADGVGTVDAVTAGATTAVTGIIAGFEPQFIGENLSETGLPALTAGKARVLISPELNYIVAVTDSDLTNVQVGLNLQVDASAATKSGGLTISNMGVISAGAATTAALKFRVVGIAKSPTTGLFDGSYARVRINNSTQGTNTAGV